MERDTTEDLEAAELMNSSGLNNLAAGGGLAAALVAALAVGAIRVFRRLKQVAAKG